MDFAKLPIGFAMALAQNEHAMWKFASMPEEQRRSVVDRAHGASSETEMRSIVSDIAAE